MLDMDSFGDPPKSCLLMSLNGISEKKLVKKCFDFANFGLKLARLGYKEGKMKSFSLALSTVNFILK